MLNKLKPKSEFTQNVLTLMSGTMIVQIIAFAASPILTRIYTPEEFGIVAIYGSIVYILATIVTAQYDVAIVLPKKDEDALNLVGLSLITTFLVSFISFLIVFIFNSQITDFFGNKDLSFWLYFIPISVLFLGITRSFTKLLNRNKQYKQLAMHTVVQSSVNTSSKLSMGFGGFGTGGLILSDILGQAIATVFLSKMIKEKDKDKFKKIKKIKIFALMRKYKKFPLYNLPNAIIDGFRLSGINILIAKLFATATLGQFSLAWKIVQVPSSLIGSSISQVFFQKVASTKKSDLYDIVIKFILKASIIAAPMFLFIYLFGPELFSFVFGENWKLAGEAASVLTPWLFLNFMTSPLSTLFIVLNKQEKLLIFAIFYMIVPLICLYIFRDSSFLEVLNTVTLSMSFMLLIFILLIIYYTRKEKNGR